MKSRVKYKNLHVVMCFSIFLESLMFTQNRIRFRCTSDYIRAKSLWRVEIVENHSDAILLYVSTWKSTVVCENTFALFVPRPFSKFRNLTLICGFTRVYLSCKFSFQRKTSFETVFLINFRREALRMFVLCPSFCTTVGFNIPRKDSHRRKALSL